MKLAWLMLACPLVLAASCIAPPHETVVWGPKMPHPEAKVKSAPIPGFMRGMNLGNGLDAPTEGEWGVRLSENHFKYIAEAGFDHVRLPARFSGHALDSAPYTIDSAFFDRVDWAIDQALSRKLSVVIDFHFYEALMNNPDHHAQRFLGLWKQIAAHFKNRPPTVAFELLNEPFGNLDVDKWNEILEKAIPLVRATNPTRLIIVDSYFWSAPDRLSGLKLPKGDPNLIGSFHTYQPILFTHQGSEWMPSEYGTMGIVFPGPGKTPVVPVPAATKVSWIKDWFDGYNTKPAAENPGGYGRVNQHFDEANEFLTTTGLRLYMGEFAAIDKADAQSRANYVRYVREEAERRGIAWAYWDDGGHMKALYPQAGRWIDYLHDALLN